MHLKFKKKIKNKIYLPLNEKKLKEFIMACKVIEITIKVQTNVYMNLNQNTDMVCKLIKITKKTKTKWYTH